jgi:hypothetical protein
LKKLMILAAMLAVAMLAVAPAPGPGRARRSVGGRQGQGGLRAGGAKAEPSVRTAYRAKAVASGGQGPVLAAAAPAAAPGSEGRPGPPPPPPSASRSAAAGSEDGGEEGGEEGAAEDRGSGTASLFALGAGALLVAGGLVARRIVKYNGSLSSLT